MGDLIIFSKPLEDSAKGPLSPFLYILMVESLSRKLTAELVAGSLPSIKIARGVDPINNALFADDSLLMGRASLNIT